MGLLTAYFPLIHLPFILVWIINRYYYRCFFGQCYHKMHLGIIEFLSSYNYVWIPAKVLSFNYLA